MRSIKSNKLFKGLLTSSCIALILVMIISPTNFGLPSLANADVSSGSGKAGSLNEAASPGKGQLTVQTASSANTIAVKQTVDLSKISSPAISNANKSISVIPFLTGPSSASPQSSVTKSVNAVPIDIQSSSSSSGPQIANQYSSFEGSDYPASCFCTPPDGNLAVGPNNVFQMVNNEGKVWSKSGALLETVPMSSFFGTGSLFISDPRVVYDAQSGHWFATELATDFTNHGFVFIAVSQTTNPAGSWFIYTPQFNDVIPDQPRLAVTDDKVTVVASDYTSGSGPFTGEEIWTLNKSQMIVGGSTNFVKLGPDTSRFHIEPAVYPVGGQTQQWLVQDGAGGATGAEYLMIDGLPGVSAVTYTSMFITPIGTTNGPPGGKQPGTTTAVATNDARILSASMRGNVITWVANDACTPAHGGSVVHSCIRWDVATNTGTLLQDLDFGSSQQDMYFPAVSQASTNDFGLIFDFSSPTEYPSIAFTGQSLGEPFNTVDNPVLVKSGTGPDTTGRHGDYHAVRADPSTGLYYGEAEYNAAGSPWNTYVSVNSISTGTASVHSTSLTINPIVSVPWGTTVTVTGKLVDTSASNVGIGGQPITFTTSAGTLQSTVTAQDGTFVTTGTAPGAPPGSVNVQGFFAGTQFFGSSSSAVVPYNTLKHVTTIFQFAPSPNNLPWGKPITLTSTLYDTTLGGIPVAGKTISWNGTGITGSPGAVTSGRGNAATTVTSKFLPGSWTVKSAFSGDASYGASTSAVGSYVTIKHATKVTLWAPLNVTKSSPVVLGATLIDLSTGGSPLAGVGKTITFNGSGVIGAPVNTVTNTSQGDGLIHDTAPNTVGTWDVICSYAGNSLYFSDTSVTKHYTTS